MTFMNGMSPFYIALLQHIMNNEVMDAAALHGCLSLNILKTDCAKFQMTGVDQRSASCVPRINIKNCKLSREHNYLNLQ